MRALLMLCVLHTGCGRFGFEPQPEEDALASDAVSCVPVGHDEDQDAVDDACDVCPHLPGGQADADGDRVGDACDPEPMLARQRIVVFDSFESRDPAWTGSSAVVVQGGQLRIGVANAARSFRRPYTFGTDVIVVAGTTGTSGPGKRIVAISMGSASPPRFFCELYDDSVSTTLKLTYTFNDTMFPVADQAPAATQFMNGSGRLSMATSATAAACASTWHGELVEATGPIPAITVGLLMLYVENVDTRLDYFVQIHTDD